MADFPIGANVQPAINNIDKLIASLRSAGKAAGLAEDEIDKLVKTAQKSGTDGATGINKINSELGNLGGIAKSVGPALAGVFALDKLKDFVGQVVNITAEFQKFEAVLTNTLGSNSAARRSLADIAKFASVTPFSVRELTDSFVRLANQGFKPTMQELRKLGDLASSTGKQFDQLTEAIIDAQTGEFERLKDFGIRASKAGDQVTFSFKGVQTQTEFTSDAIRQYILTLGDLDGVSGSMAAISQTLGGQINNLGDSWGKFMETLGDGNKGALSGAVSLLDKALKIATDLVTTNDQRRDKQQTAVYSEQFDKTKMLYEQVKDINKAREESIRFIGEELRSIDAQMQNLDSQIAKYETNRDAGIFNKRNVTPAEQQSYLQTLDTRNQLVNRYNDLVNEGQKGVLEAAKEIEKTELDIAKRKEQGVRLTKQQTDAEQRRLQTVRDFARELEEIEMRWSIVSATKTPLQDIAKSTDTLGSISPLSLKPAESTSTADAQKSKLENRKNLEQAGFDFSVNLINTLSAIQSEADQMERQRLQDKYNYELSLAGNNETAKAKIKADFEKKDRELQQRQAQRNREMAMFNIIANTAESIIKTGANLGYPAAIPFQIFAGITGAVQLAAVLNAKLPRFKDGVFDLNGPGTETSDSILSLLSAHESVVPARKSRKFKDILQPIIEDENVSYNDLKNIIDRNIPNAVRGDLFLKLKQESDPVMHEVRDILRDIKNKPTTGKGIDAKGLYDYMERDGVVKKTYKQNYFW